MFKGQITEYGFQNRLAVIKAPFDSDILNIIIEYAGHLPFLKLTGFAFRKHNEDVDVSLAPDTRYRCATGIAAGCSEYIQRASTGLEDVLEHVSQKLQSNILKCQCGSVEQLHNMKVVHFPKRCH